MRPYRAFYRPFYHPSYRPFYGCALLAILTWTFLSLDSADSAAQLVPARMPPNGRLAQADPPPLETDLELLTVTVSNKNGAVTGLGQDRFQVLEDGVEQKIAYFWVDNRPISVGFVIDGSSAMTDEMNEAIRGAGAAFLKSKALADEYFVIVFSDSPSMVVSYTTDAKLMPRVYPQHGEQPLYDAIYNALDAMKEAANPRKALLVITSSGDNGKGENRDQLVNFAIKQPVQIYSLDMGGASEAALTLDELAGITGGRANVAPDNTFGLEAMSAELAQALKTQYLIGYKSNAAKDGHRHGVKVKVSSPAGSPKLTVWTQSGYYAPKESKVKTTAVKGK